MFHIEKPYLLFIGDAADQLAAKTAQGVLDWRREWCLGQMRLSGCKADLDLPDMTLRDAVGSGVKTLIVGVANRGGIISDVWIEVLQEALERGLDLASGLHSRLADVPALAETAARCGRQLFDVRHPNEKLAVGTGKRRTGKRLLTVGTDCSVGKMYTSLALEAAMRERGMKADFRATGQTGILIAGEGISVDAVVADFISGAVEQIAPENDPDHWDLIEGQGSLFHASFAGVSLGLLHGAQPDAMVLCHEPTRAHMRGLPEYGLPTITECIELNLRVARLTNPNPQFVGVSINTSGLNEHEAENLLAGVALETGLPAVDPLRNGVAPIVERLTTLDG